MQTVPLRAAPVDVFLKRMLLVSNVPTKSARRVFAVMKPADLLQVLSAVCDLALPV